MTSLALSSPSSLLWLAAAAVFFLAGIVKGVVGLGLPTLSMALLTLLLAPPEAAALLIVPSLVTNLWQLRPWRTLGPLLRRLAPMQWGVCAGTLAGAWCFGAPGGIGPTLVLGAVLVVYGVWGLTGSKLSVPPGMERWSGPVVGALTGIVTAATGVFVVPAVAYLQALDLKRDELIQAMGISFTVSTVVLGIALACNGRYSGADASLSLLMLIPALAGMAAGQVLRQKLSASVFRTCFLVSLTALGMDILVRGVMAH